MSVLIVSGTGTDVGKTVVTAALAACAEGRVAVVKPAQTGAAPGAKADLAEIGPVAGRNIKVLESDPDCIGFVLP